MDKETTYGSSCVQALRIFRFNYDNLVLTSVAKGDIWLPGEIMRSHCGFAKHHGHLKPEVECMCGIWSCKGRAGLHKTFPPSVYNTRGHGTVHDFPFMLGKVRYPLHFVSAQIEQWGVVIEHEWGYRSEYARIIPQSIQVYPRTEKPRHKKLITLLREKYGISARF
jgi:hypothetical protein